MPTLRRTTTCKLLWICLWSFGFANVVGQCGTSVRRAWKDLSCREQQDYLDAVNLLNDAGIYRLFTLAHFANAEHTHGTPIFFPWHRWFLWRFEKELQRVSDSCITVPYWDSERDAGNEFDSSVLEPHTFGSAYGGTNSNRCVVDGAFQWRNTAIWNCLQRDYNGAATFLDERIVMQRIFDSDDFDTFGPALEGGPHANPHIFVGAQMATHFSPDDPLFWLHHSNVDRWWAIWQVLDGQDELTAARVRSWHACCGILDRAMPFLPNVGATAEDPLFFNPNESRPPTAREVWINHGDIIDVQYSNDRLARRIVNQMGGSQLGTGTWITLYERDSGCGSPTVPPSSSPTVSPTASPTASPTVPPTASPTHSPTFSPTVSPTSSPTGSSPTTTSPTSSPTRTAAPTVGAITTKTREFSDEPDNDRGSCPTEFGLQTTMIGLNCEGQFCDNLIMTCYNSGFLEVDSAVSTSPSFSEEGNGIGECPGTNEVVTGIRCKGKWCDNLFLSCQKLTSVTLDYNNCGETSSFPSQLNQDGYGEIPGGAYTVGIKCSGSWCGRKALRYCFSNSGPITSQTHQFSDESGNDQASCKNSNRLQTTMIGLSCNGIYCDNLSMNCYNSGVLQVDSAVSMSPSFSEEGNGIGECSPTNQVITGLKCRGRYCDNLNLFCQNLTSVELDYNNCGETSPIPSVISQNESGEIPTGAYSVGIKCSGHYCAHKALRYCYPVGHGSRGRVRRLGAPEFINVMNKATLNKPDLEAIKERLRQQAKQDCVGVESHITQKERAHFHLQDCPQTFDCFYDGECSYQ